LSFLTFLSVLNFIFKKKSVHGLSSQILFAAAAILNKAKAVYAAFPRSKGKVKFAAIFRLAEWGECGNIEKNYFWRTP